MQHPTPWSEAGTGREEEQTIERREGCVVTSLVIGSRVVDPDERSGDVSYSPGSYCPLEPLLNTLFIGCLIDYMLLGNIHKDLELQLETGHISWLNEVVTLDGLKQVGSQTNLSDSSSFLCRPGVRLNSSLIEWLFTGRCEMPALLQSGSWKVGVSLAFVCLWSQSADPIVRGWPASPSDSPLLCFVTNRVTISFIRVRSGSWLWTLASPVCLLRLHTHKPVHTSHVPGLTRTTGPGWSWIQVLMMHKIGGKHLTF